MANKFKNTGLGGANPTQSFNQPNSRAVLKLALRGQLFDNSDDAGYVYPPNSQGAAAWLMRGEYRVILNDLNVKGLGKGCVSVWLTPEGVCYSVCRRRPGRGGSDTVAAAVYASVVAANTGQLLLQIGSLLDYVIDIADHYGQCDNIDNNRVAEYMEGMRRCFGPLKPPTSNIQSTSESEPRPMAWKVYDNQFQLENELRYLPFQPQMQQFQAVHLLLKDVISTGVAANMVEFTYPVKPVFAIDLGEISEGVSVCVEGNARYTISDEPFTIVYSKPGYLEVRKGGQMAGRQSQFFDVDYTRNVITLTPYSKNLGIRFIRRMKLTVRDESDRSVPEWRWESRSNRMLCGNQNGLELPEGQHDIVVMATGYVDKPVHIDTNAKIDKVTLTQRGFESSANMVPAWGGVKPGSDTSVTISGKQSNWMYGKFNLSPTSRKPKLYVSKSSPWLWVLLAGLLMGAAGVMAGHYLWKPQAQTQSVQGSGSATTPPDKSNEGQQDPKPQPSQNETGMTQAELEAADKDYLERNGRTWYRDSLQSEKYLKFFDVELPNGTLDRNINWDASMLDFMKAIKHNRLRKYVASYEEAKKKNKQPLWDVFNQYAKNLKTAVASGTVDWNTIFAQPKNTPVTSQPRKGEENDYNG